eukprot:COSAG06_NODE_18764_length_870_cov_1.123217_2_plen_90_part_01
MLPQVLERWALASAFAELPVLMLSHVLPDVVKYVLNLQLPCPHDAQAFADSPSHRWCHRRVLPDDGDNHATDGSAAVHQRGRRTYYELQV